MNKVSKLGMLFNEGNVPDFGSIQMKSNNTNIYYLSAQDIPKLNGMLTKETAASYLTENETLDICSGALAFVVDHQTANSGKIYVYHRDQDHWYEFNIRSDLGLWDFMWNRHARILRELKEISGTPPLTFKSNGRPLKNYRIYGNTVNGQSVGDLVTEGEHDGEYCVPVTITNGTDTKTTNIYLPKQIIKLGSESEYIDYKKQKLHMVRKNLFDISAITENTWIRRANGELTPTQNSDLSAYIPVTQNTAYTLSWRITEPLHSTSPREYLWFNSDFIKIADGSYDVVNNNSEAIFSPQNAKYLRFDYDKSFLDIMLNVGSAPLSYESYIANDELDVTLPPLPTIVGTNTLSVGTNLQPSTIEVKGKIKEVE